MLVGCAAAPMPPKAEQPLRFHVTLTKEAAAAGAEGRLLVLMSSAPAKPEFISYAPGSTWIAAQEVTHIPAGGMIEFDPDIIAYPQPLSHAKTGTYHFMALLDADHSYAFSGPGDGDLRGPVVTTSNLNPALGGKIELTLDRRIHREEQKADGVTWVEFQSPMLTAFWGRPIVMKAGVVLPPGYEKDSAKRYATVYHVHGFGRNWVSGAQLTKAMTEGRRAEMVHVFLDASFPTGHHVFADSVNNGPWGAALTQEFVPYLEKRFRVVNEPYARFLTGHSSGGWSTLWLQVTYPDFFGGVWSTSPDPVDLRSYTGINVTPGSKDNAYRDSAGKVRNLIRRQGKNLTSFEEYAKLEAVEGDIGGQLSSFEWVWSPKGPDGRPMQVFNRETGELYPAVEEAWQKYDIRLIMERDWKTLEPKLHGKLHIICGEEDTFHLEEGVKLLGEFLRRVKSDAVVELIPGRDHSNLYQPYEPSYPKGLEERIDREMKAAFDRATSGK
jgi:S-formylglutathione hydrolase FrmB